MQRDACTGRCWWLYRDGHPAREVRGVWQSAEMSAELETAVSNEFRSAPARSPSPFSTRASALLPKPCLCALLPRTHRAPAASEGGTARELLTETSRVGLERQDTDEWWRERRL